MTFVKVAGLLLIGAVMLALGLGLWALLYWFAAPYVTRSFSRRDLATIRNYHIYTPDITEANVNSEQPVLILTVEGSAAFGSYLLDTAPVDTDTLMRTLNRAGQSPAFWYDKAEWDQLLLGTDIAVGLSPSGRAVVPYEQVRRARRDVAQFVLAVMILVGLFVGVPYLR